MMLLVRYMYIKTNALVLACSYFVSKTILKGDMLHYSRTVVKRTLRDSYTIHVRYQGFSVFVPRARHVLWFCTVQFLVIKCGDSKPLSTHLLRLTRHNYNTNGKLHHVSQLTNYVT